MAQPLKIGHILAAGFLGLVAGVALGWAAFSRTPPSVPPSAAASSDSLARTGNAVREPIAPPGGHLAEAVAPAPPARDGNRALEVPAGTPGPPKEAVLEARIRALEKELGEQKAALLEAAGQPLTEPKDLPDRFKQKALLDAVLSGFREVNPAAEVTSVDCTEYPCIVYGTGMSVEQAKSLAKTAAFRPYDGDRNSLSIEDGAFAFFTTPKDDPNAKEDVDRRVSSRISQMAYSSKPH